MLAPLVVHSQTMNGLRRSFLCRVKKSQKGGQSSSQSPEADIDCKNSETVIKLLQSTQQCVPYQYAVLYCTGFIRYVCNLCNYAATYVGTHTNMLTGRSTHTDMLTGRSTH